MMAWCNGAPGIALGRLQLTALLDGEEEIEDDLALALDITRDAEESNFDFVCCGNMGRAEILLTAATRLGRDLLAASHALASGVADRGFLRQLEPTHPHYNPGFFRGAAGVGYAFLRCAEPALPCVLSLE